jgi:hypothetical protein
MNELALHQQITTESGAVYEIDGSRVRRVNPSHEKRGDGDWQQLRTMFPKTPMLGYPMVLVMDTLRRYGGDDHGTPDDLADDVTTRRTTPVRLIKQLGPASVNRGTPDA